MNDFSFFQRSSIIKKMAEESFDLLVIGGGITGAGVARDAALRGMKVALIEAADFASGTSSRSSKLIHGGLRYLENMEFHLVFEALSERQKLFEMAPNLVHPLRFMVPIYKQSRVGMFKMGLGMWAYDALSLFQAPELHERLNAISSVERIPSLQSKDLMGSYVYSDAYMDDDRLVHETLRSAVRAGASVLNYVRADSPLLSGSKVSGATAVDMVTEKKVQIKARHVVSSVGVWTDLVGQQFDAQWKKILRPTKGVHLTFRNSRLPLTSAVVMAAESRIVFAIPRHEMVIVGTTDTDFSGDPATVKVEMEDVTYLLSVIDKYFPGAQINESDIVASYAGVRPLVYDGSATEGKTSREHTIFTAENGVTYVAGGKYTTYRLMAEQIVNEALNSFGIEEQIKWGRCTTDRPLNEKITAEAQGQKSSIVDELLRMTTWSLAEAEKFFDRHGGEAIEVLKNIPLLRRKKMNSILVEAFHAIYNTMCFHLVDFYSRRVPLFLAEEDHGLRDLDAIAELFSTELNWSSADRENQIKSLHDYMAKEGSWASASKKQGIANEAP